jgi:hypothetical protein
MLHHIPRIQRIPPFTALTVALVLGFTACQAGSTSPAEAETADTSPEALRDYYESHIADLNQALLNERQEEYISRRHYENRIAELESRLEAESSLQSPADTSPDISVSLPAPERETTPPAPTAAFRYTLRSGAISIDAYTGTAKSIVLPAEITALPVTRIADDAFRGASVTEITVPESVTEIGWFAFADCTDLQTVILPASVTSIAYGAFDGYPHITLLCPAESYAARYARSFGLSYRLLP